MKVISEALAVGTATLEPYSHSSSPHKYTQAQLFACLVLKTFFGMDYRGVEQMLRDCPDLQQRLDLRTVPHFTTLQKACQRLMRQKNVISLLETTVRRYGSKKSASRLKTRFQSV
jgi:Transposase domain (DUF772)